MAEVSLTIGDVDGANLKSAGVEVDFNEVTLTRRVFRDGASEYFINKVPCRLKDLQQLFMGTGVGRTSYSIMAQGNITQLLSSKPEDRRMVFEEAAGITKFKAQKREALRKLDYTEQNLLRISDLIREVKRQIGSLQRQAGKARRYKQLSLELQHLDTQLARHQYDVLQGEIRERQTTVEALRTEIEVFSENVLRAENEITQLRERLAELEHEISQSQHQGLELKNQIDLHEHAIHFNQERLHEIESQNTKALADIAQAEDRRGVAQEEMTVVEQQLSASVMTRDRYRQALQSKKEAIESLEASLRTQQESLRKWQGEAFTAAQQLSRVRNEINALDLQKQGNIVRLEKLSAEKIQLEEERTRLEARLLEFTSQVEAEKLNVELQQGTVEEREERLGQIRQQLNTTAQELENRFQQIAEKKSRLNVLEQLEAEHEGFSAGTLAALNLSQNEQQVLGSLADRIRVSDQYVDAIEAALGHHLQLVLTAHQDAAQQILAHLSITRPGQHVDSVCWKAASDASDPQTIRSNFAVTTLLPTWRRTPSIQRIDAAPSVQPLFAASGQTWIVPDLSRATGLARKPGTMRSRYLERVAESFWCLHWRLGEGAGKRLPFWGGRVIAALRPAGALV
jgi:chromosome segregation protein